MDTTAAGQRPAQYARQVDNSAGAGGGAVGVAAGLRPWVRGWARSVVEVTRSDLMLYTIYDPLNAG